jgi:hypothetical protein
MATLEVKLSVVNCGERRADRLCVGDLVCLEGTVATVADATFCGANPGMMYVDFLATAEDGQECRKTHFVRRDEAFRVVKVVAE